MEISFENFYVLNAEGDTDFCSIFLLRDWSNNLWYGIPMFEIYHETISKVSIILYRFTDACHTHLSNTSVELGNFREVVMSGYSFNYIVNTEGELFWLSVWIRTITNQTINQTINQTYVRHQLRQLDVPRLLSVSATVGRSRAIPIIENLFVLTFDRQLYHYRFRFHYDYGENFCQDLFMSEVGESKLLMQEVDAIASDRLIMVNIKYDRLIVHQNNQIRLFLPRADNYVEDYAMETHNFRRFFRAYDSLFSVEELTDGLFRYRGISSTVLSESFTIDGLNYEFSQRQLKRSYNH